MKLGGKKQVWQIQNIGFKTDKTDDGVALLKERLKELK